MKIFTRNLILFAISFFVLTIAFRFLLSYSLQNNLFNAVWIYAVAYGLLAFLFGWFFGSREKNHIALYDVGFRFHLATFIISNSVAELWFLFEFQSDKENVIVIHLTLLIWAVVLFFHFIMFMLSRKNAIKGIKKSEIFE